MDFDELSCTICLSQFDKEEHLPLMVPKCGHTFCSKCLIETISNLPSDADFICPEDQTPMKLQNRDISEFPQNFTLLRLLDKRSLLSDKQSSSFSREDRSSRKENKLFSDKSPSSTRDLSSPLGSPGCLTKDGYSLRNSFSQQDMFNLMHADMNMCREHNRKLEVVCLEHKCRICANCALFGTHKGHDIKPEEDVLREIATRAERLIDIFQAMEKSQSVIVEHDAAEKVNERIKRKCEDVTKAVRQRVNDYVAAIRTRERKILSEIGEKFSRMQEGFSQIRQLPQELGEKINKWKTRTHDSLLAVTEKSERGEISFDLLEDRANQKNDLLLQGEKFILDLERLNEVNLRLLETNLAKVSLTFDSGLAKSVETLCIVEVPEVNLASRFTDVYNHNNNTRDDSIISLPLKDAVNKSPQNSRQNNEFLDTEKQDQTTMSRSPNKQTASKYSLDNEEYEDDNNHNLLSFEWKDLSSENQAVDTSSNFGKEYTIKVNGHRKFSSGDMTNKSRDNKENAVNRTPTSIRSQTQLTVPDDFEYQTTLKTGGSGSGGRMTRAVSPSKKGNEQGGKQGKAKKKSAIKVTDKYEGVIEGIEQNMLETGDLTAAELGDQGVLALIEMLKENTALKSLKLLKNKITDEAGMALADLFYYNNTIQTLNLTQNQLTERTLDAFIDVVKAQPGMKLKSIYFSQNAMSLRNVKGKLKELEKMGVNAIM